MRVLLITAAALGFVVVCFADDAVQITTHPAYDRYAAWSPDDTTIAFTSDRTTVADIYTIPATGGTATRLTYHSSSDTYPEWSPDGNTIVYFRTAGEELWKIPSTGGTPTRFTYNSVFDFCPSWSSDDTKITCHGYYAKSGGNAQNKNDIFWVPADDGSAGPYLIITGWDNRRPEWAPNSSDKIAFSRDPGDNINQIWVKTLGGAAYAVTDDSYDNYKPSWSPGGQYLAYGSDRSGNDDIWIIPATGGTPIQVTDDAANDFHPDWSPNGDKIAFTSGRSGSYDIWVIDVSGLVNVKSASLGEIKAHYATDEMKRK
ncbi:MAG: hypothetical protein GY771_15055 [bacterium]|nr:hypothetical protein [bacterium]